MKSLSDKALQRVANFQGILPKKAQGDLGGGRTYAQAQLSYLVDDSEYPSSLQVVDGEGNRTNWMSVDNEVLDALDEKFRGMP